MNDNKRKSIKHAKVITEICVSAVILTTAGYFIHTITGRMSDVSTSPFIENSSTVDVLDEIPEEDGKTIFESIEVNTKNKFKGDLMLVNNNTQYYSGDENLVTVTEQIEVQGWTSFVGNDNTLQVRSNVCTAMGNMLEAFYSATNINDIVVISGYRTQDDQKSLYDEDLAATGLDYSDRVAKPGYSEHQTGYAVDFTTSTTWDYDGQGAYGWIDENCWKYGFILRYPENKTEITQIKYEPWHYRYVGVAHAYYMYKNGLALEEYISLLRNYTYEGEHLCFTDDNGSSYEIYFVPSDDANETTYVPVPVELDYTISGNNVDGFIVTINTTAENGTEPTTAAPAITDDSSVDDSIDEVPVDESSIADDAVIDDENTDEDTEE